MLESRLATSRVGTWKSLLEKEICFTRAGVIDMVESTPSNLRDLRPGIMPSNAFSTHTHFALRRRHSSLPTSMSKPTSEPSGAFDSKGG
ncbi:hypothetical protein AWB79_02515 [Caballeronia hypogeia]|uniref:Uncharacterized protein n=1 Tax=Caballeronia hypogeia TaxID=1777140 RepID=A0A158AKR9_9BURK|nr:hypothetical protein AWB79_02515 [Caballeronia hypogeia]